jgi:hypothetical protein
MSRRVRCAATLSAVARDGFTSSQYSTLWAVRIFLVITILVAGGGLWASYTVAQAKGTHIHIRIGSWCYGVACMCHIVVSA